jgi:hypothetical protein
MFKNNLINSPFDSMFSVLTLLEKCRNGYVYVFLTSHYLNTGTTQESINPTCLQKMDGKLMPYFKQKSTL